MTWKGKYQYSDKIPPATGQLVFLNMGITSHPSNYAGNAYNGYQRFTNRKTVADRVCDCKKNTAELYKIKQKVKLHYAKQIKEFALELSEGHRVTWMSCQKEAVGILESEADLEIPF